MTAFGEDTKGSANRLLIALVAFICVVVLFAAGTVLVMGKRSSTPRDTPGTPVWKLHSYKKIGYVHSYKLDLLAQLPSPPKLMTIGGSRTTRFEPNYMRTLTGLSTMNCSVSNCEPADVWAFANHLRARAPKVKLRLLWGVQVGGFFDDPFAQGLAYDPRLARWFPAELIDEQKALIGKPIIKNLLSVNRFTRRGMLEYCTYNRQRERGLTLSASLDKWIPIHKSKETKAGDRSTVLQRSYFEKTMKLFNDEGVTPCIIMMPYQPRALRALRAVPKWKANFDDYKAYLESMQSTYDFRLLDYTDIKSFGGHPDWFFDGAHITIENSRLLLKKAVKQAPECFK